MSLVTAVLLAGQQSNAGTTFDIIRRHCGCGCGEGWHAGNGQSRHAHAVLQAVANTCSHTEEHDERNSHLPALTQTVVVKL